MSPLKLKLKRFSSDRDLLILGELLLTLNQPDEALRVLRKSRKQTEDTRKLQAIALFLLHREKEGFELMDRNGLLEMSELLRQNPAFHLPDEAIREGLNRVVELTGLQGRWQTVRLHPRVVLDTGHNVAGIENVVRQLREQTCRTLRTVIGMVSDKDIDAVLTLLPREATYYFTQARTARALPASDLQAKAAPVHLHGTAYPTVAQAVQAALHDAAPDDFIFIGGSNFVVGEALEEM